MTTIYSLHNIKTMFVHKAARYTSTRYYRYGVERDDVAQEIRLWLFVNEERVKRWLSEEPQKTTRVYRSMLDVALKYAEKQKAEKVGYHPDDVYWYTASSVEALLPLVLDPTYVEDDGSMSERISTIIDIRRALSTADVQFFTHNSSSHPNWTEAIQNVVNKLGGERPYVGRRRPMSNARAQAETGEAYSG